MKRWLGSFRAGFFILFLGELFLAAGCATLSSSAPVPLEGKATWYVSGSLRLAAAHPDLPLGTRVRVTNLLNERQVIVTVTEHFPRKGGQIIRLAEEAAKNIKMNPKGSTPVRLEVLRGRWNIE